MPAPVITSYSAFWPYYLSEHRRFATKALHIVGTGLSLTLIIAGVALKRWELAAVAVVTGYFFAWVGHFFIERNKPATFRYPFWSLISDFRLFYTFMLGGLANEYRRYGIEQ